MLIRLLFLLFTVNLVSAEESNVYETLVREHAQRLTARLPGEAQIEIGPIDSQRLPPCPRPETFSAPGSRALGKINIGLRCHQPKRWSILVPVRIRLIGNYIVTSRPLAAGQKLSIYDLALASGDLAALPAGVLTDPAQAVGKTLRNALGAGLPIRKNQLSAPLVIRSGQTVKVISQGPGFAVSAEGKAMNQAGIGELVQVRMPSGQTIRGIAEADGTVNASN